MSWLHDSGLHALLLAAGALVIAWALVQAVRFRRRLETLVDERTRELAESNRRLREAKEAAIETNRAKSHFLASMSHEIRTPLTSILGYTDLLLRTELGPRERLKNLHTIRRNGQHLLELVNDVLDISKIEAGEMTVEVLDCSPWQLVREVRSLLKSQAAAKGLAFEIEAEGPIPEYLRSDPVRLRQILLNLVGNAIKFTDSGGVRVKLRLEVPEEASVRLCFDVIDTGIGLSDEEREGVFRPFRQASSSTSRVYGGTGLGLAISQHLARMLGGEITVSSVPGEGATFTLAVGTGDAEGVPLMDGPFVAETLEMTTPTGGGPGGWSRTLGGRILLAEDGVDNRRFIAAVLQQVGAEVTLVENGRQAVERTLAARDRGEPYDAVLMDMQMPVLDGYAAARKLREEGYEGKIVALTAYAMAGDREKCLEAGCDDHVAKPIDVERFLEALARHVDGSREPPETPLASTLADHPSLGALVRGFVDRLPERLEELRTAFRESNLPALSRHAHTLRGAGGTYGFEPLSKAAEALEQRLRNGAEPHEVRSAFARLENVCRRVMGSAADG